MALKYADYVKEDQLEAEIEAADVQEQIREHVSTIPERFKGKSLEDVAQSYVELEKLYSRQAQDLGSMRRTVDTLLELQPSDNSNSQAATEPNVPVTVDNIYDDPDGSIRRVVREETTGQIKEVHKTLEELRREQAQRAFDAAHPGWQDTANDGAFINWVREAPYRMRLAQASNVGDLDAADTLLSMYGDMQARVTAEQEQAERAQTKRALRNASLETSGPIPHESVETFSRSDLISRRLAAKRGDEAQDRWLRVNADKILAAYADNRVTD